jgi:excisionase family DNA binding protein
MGPQSSDSQVSKRFSKKFGTHLVPGSAATREHGGAQAGADGQGATPAPKTRQRASVAPTLADLRVLWGGRDRLLKVAEVAEHLGVCNTTVYRLCDSGELPHVWIVNSIRIRPADLEVFLQGQPVSRERGDR